MNKSIVILLLSLIVLIACSTSFYSSEYGETQTSAPADSTQENSDFENSDLFYENPLNKELEQARQANLGKKKNPSQNVW